MTTAQQKKLDADIDVEALFERNALLFERARRRKLELSELAHHLSHGFNLYYVNGKYRLNPDFDDEVSSGE